MLRGVRNRPVGWSYKRRPKKEPQAGHVGRTHGGGFCAGSPVAQEVGLVMGFMCKAASMSLSGMGESMCIEGATDARAFEASKSSTSLPLRFARDRSW